MLLFPLAFSLLVPLSLQAQHPHSAGVHRFESPGEGGVALQSDGKVLLWGLFTEVNGIPRDGLARLDEDGRLDTTWIPAAIPAIEQVVVAGSEILFVSRTEDSTFSEISLVFSFLDRVTGAVLERNPARRSRKFLRLCLWYDPRWGPADYCRPISESWRG